MMERRVRRKLHARCGAGVRRKDNRKTLSSLTYCYRMRD